jgi:16S rRNA pseudouridine516 synthase
MRLDKFICKSTELTRAEAIECINSGLVTVNGVASRMKSNAYGGYKTEIEAEQITAATQVHENNIITLNGQQLTPRPFRYLLMHKTAGTICSNVDGDYPSLFNQLDIEYKDELHIAGRLDVDTTGLVLITDDGRWTYNITRPDKDCNKVYRVELSYGIPELKAASLIERFKQGIQLQGEQGLTQPALLEMLPSDSGGESRDNKGNESKNVLLTITEGKYHQVKRMFAAVGNRVLSLHREKIGDVQLDVEEGRWRYLTAEEVKAFIQ